MTNLHPYPLRLPEALWQAISRAAHSQYKSLAAWILQAILEKCQRDGIAVPAPEATK